jgi:hypothetical protein
MGLQCNSSYWTMDSERGVSLSFPHARSFALCEAVGHARALYHYDQISKELQLCHDNCDRFTTAP